MVQLELLDENNEEKLLKIQRQDVPECYVEKVSDTIALAKYGEEHNLKGHCFAIKCDDNYVGIMLTGEAIEDPFDPPEVKGKEYFRILGFVIDSRYQNKGIGSASLKLAIEAIYHEYGKVTFLLECHKENVKAIRFYEKNGFHNTQILNEKSSDYYMILK